MYNFSVPFLKLAVNDNRDQSLYPDDRIGSDIVALSHRGLLLSAVSAVDAIHSHHRQEQQEQDQQVALVHDGLIAFYLG